MHFLEQQAIAAASSPPVLLVPGCLAHASPLVRPYEADNVTQVQAKGQSPHQYASERALQGQMRDRYFPCHKEPYENVIFITVQGDVPHCIRRKTDLM